MGFKILLFVFEEELVNHPFPKGFKRILFKAYSLIRKAVKNFNKSFLDQFPDHIGACCIRNRHILDTSFKVYHEHSGPVRRITGNAARN
ncbi:Uncharacterised protein [Mycobacteroides abscessus subsp. abscessus]|nr:Uncharacterised protein [Mycobacteroides abscessus subsp. abscessus]